MIGARATGTTRTTFRVAVNGHWTGADGQAKEHVEWYRVICFGRLAFIDCSFVLLDVCSHNR
jgi:single-stranded DNA-binding protein